MFCQDTNAGVAKPGPGQPQLGVPADDPRLQGAARVQPPRRRRPHEQPPDHRLHQVSNQFLAKYILMAMFTVGTMSTLKESERKTDSLRAKLRLTPPGNGR